MLGSTLGIIRTDGPRRRAATGASLVRVRNTGTRHRRDLHVPRSKRAAFATSAAISYAPSVATMLSATVGETS